MSSSPVIKEGYVKFQSKKIGVWKKRWLVLRRRNGGGYDGVVLEKYENETGALMGQVKRILNLQNMLNISRIPDSVRKHAISILLEGTLECVKFSLDSELEASAWMSAINNRSAAATESKDKFSLYAMQHPKLPIHGECVLQITDTHLTVYNSRHQEVVQWSLNKLRRYAIEKGIFSLETGRSSSTGEGVFLFEGDEAEDAYQRLNFLIKNAATSKTRSPVIQSADEPPPYDPRDQSFRRNEEFDNFSTSSRFSDASCYSAASEVSRSDYYASTRSDLNR